MPDTFFGAWRCGAGAGRYCNPGELDDVDRRNGLDSKSILGLMEYLVLGHFEQGPRDEKGFDSMRWFTLEQLNESEIDDSDVDKALDEWEAASAAARKQALAAVRRAAA